MYNDADVGKKGNEIKELCSRGQGWATKMPAIYNCPQTQRQYREDIQIKRNVGWKGGNERSLDNIEALNMQQFSLAYARGRTRYR